MPCPDFTVEGSRVETADERRMMKQAGLARGKMVDGNDPHSFLLMSHAGEGNNSWCVWQVESIIVRCAAFQAFFLGEGHDPYITTRRLYDFV